MEQAVSSSLAGWESFYVIIGSASAALIGLQFVVIVLSAEMKALTDDTTTSAFATPTIVHFCAALFISAVLSVPWTKPARAGVVLGVCGLAGLLYVAMVIRQARRQKDYVLVLEDWVWHGVLPIIAYAALLLTAFRLQDQPGSSLFAVGGVALLLLFIGIHNSWDSVVYIAVKRREHVKKGEEQPERKP